MNKKEIISKLKPFWKRREDESYKFIKKQIKIEEEMNKKLKKYFNTELEFFYVDGQCVGIGAVMFNDRKKFPLIHDSELH